MFLTTKEGKKLLLEAGCRIVFHFPHGRSGSVNIGITEANSSTPLYFKSCPSSNTDDKILFPSGLSERQMLALVTLVGATHGLSVKFVQKNDSYSFYQFIK